MKRSQIDIDSLASEELLKMIREDQDNISLVYKQSKNYCINFLRGKNYKLNDEDLMDIYQDSVIVFYEKAINDINFILTSSVKTFLCSVCNYKLLKTVGKADSIVRIEDKLNFLEIEEEDEKFIKDNEVLYNSLEKALGIIKDSGGKCYELLTFFWYQKKSMRELTDIFGYTNEQNTKNQKAKCQKRLEKIAFEQLKNAN